MLGEKHAIEKGSSFTAWRGHQALVAVVAGGRRSCGLLAVAEDRLPTTNALQGAKGTKFNPSDNDFANLQAKRTRRPSRVLLAAQPRWVRCRCVTLCDAHKALLFMSNFH